MNLSKSDYLQYRDCKKNAWLKIHKPEIYKQFPPSEFDKSLMETGMEVELVARNLFLNGKMINAYGEKGKEITQAYLKKKEMILFQPVFIEDGFQAKIDVLKYIPESDCYSIFEIKSTSEIDQKVHPYDLAFQVNLLRKAGLKVSSINLIHLNKEYIRSGELNTNLLFKINDLTEEINGLCEEVNLDMESAKKYLNQENQPEGNCSCIYKGRSNHCTAFKVFNSNIPEYSIHDISRIGSSKAKLAELVDSNIFEITNIPLHIKLSATQQNQVEAFKQDRILLKTEEIRFELNQLKYPLYFLDYETCPSAIPKYDGYSPFMQIPFQYSIHKLNGPDSEVEHLEFLHIADNDPSLLVIDSLKKHIGVEGNIIVWSKTFETTIHNKISERHPQYKEYLDSINFRIFDLMEIFSKQYYVHKDFRGSTSIKNVLPVLVPELSYKNLTIQEGTDAFLNWAKLIENNLSEDERNEIINNLKLYCGQDSIAMYKIWKHLNTLFIN